MKNTGQQNFGWLLLGSAIIGILWVLFKKSQAAPAKPSSVSHTFFSTWDSRSQTPPSTVVGPPFQDSTGALSCNNFPGFTLWQDTATGNFACYKDGTSPQPLASSAVSGGGGAQGVADTTGLSLYPVSPAPITLPQPVAVPPPVNPDAGWGGEAD